MDHDGLSTLLRAVERSHPANYRLHILTYQADSKCRPAGPGAAQLVAAHAAAAAACASDCGSSWRTWRCGGWT